MSTHLSQTFQSALQYAFSLHQKQRRKRSGVPYFSHLMAVCALVLEDGGSEDEAIAALLHDAVEDQGGQSTLSEIQEKFGSNVAEIVAACSDSYSFPKPPWRQRKEAFLNSLSEVPPGALRVILADKIHNLQTIFHDYLRIGDKVWKIFKGGRDGTLWYYARIAAFFAEQPPGLLRDRFLDDYNTFSRTINKDRA
ncbi:MAG: HD domain-containing protein [Anaerolineales bacterium]|nr:HD domain-containing protein [Anaerolineales bacterium]